MKLLNAKKDVAKAHGEHLISGYDWTEVDAWMPLPKFYKKEAVDET